MLIWKSPKLLELDVRLTAKNPGTTERLASLDGRVAAYDVAEGDINDFLYDPNKKPGVDS